MSDAGTERRRRAQGAKTDRIQESVAKLDSQIADWVDSFVFGDVWGRPGLSEEDRTMVAITALATTQQSDQLRVYLFGAVQRGYSITRLHETLVMLSVYAGFPVALQSLQLWSEVLESARKQGVDIESGKEQS